MGGVKKDAIQEQTKYYSYFSYLYRLIKTKPTIFTVVCISESVWPNLCSNCPIFDLMFNDINKPPCSSPCGSNLTLTGALKWDTVWSSSSTGTGNTQGQSENFEIYLIENRCSTLTFPNAYTSWARTSYCISF